VTSQLGTRKSPIFFYSVACINDIYVGGKPTANLTPNSLVDPVDWFLIGTGSEMWWVTPYIPRINCAGGQASPAGYITVSYK
jgi:hypothetical protein